MTHETIYIVFDAGLGHKYGGSWWPSRELADEYLATLLADPKLYAGPLKVIQYTMTALVDVPADAWTEEARP